MTDFDIEINARELEGILRELDGGHLGDWLRGLAEDGTNRMKLSMGTSPAGREYTRGGVRHVASQPGFPPNVDTGSLRASLHWEKREDLDYIIADGVKHGEWMELGTEHIQARPFARPVISDLRREIMNGDSDGDILP